MPWSPLRSLDEEVVPLIVPQVIVALLWQYAISTTYRPETY